jgi:hypothetical protein
MFVVVAMMMVVVRFRESGARPGAAPKQIDNSLIGICTANRNDKAKDIKRLS